MTKSAIKKELKGMFNESRVLFDGINIARVCWREPQWLIIENDETFDDAKQKGFMPIDEFRTQDELVDRLYKTINYLSL